MLSAEARFRVDEGVTVEREPTVDEDIGFVPFFQAGDGVEGEFHCSGCGYGVTIYRTLPCCPMCGGETWEATARSPLRTQSETGSR